MQPIVYIDRLSGKLCEEKVLGGQLLNLLYGQSWVSQRAGQWLLNSIVRHPWFSKAYGYWQNTPFTKRYIEPFIRDYKINSAEFEKPIADYHSFNDFFIRRLKKECRPIDQNALTAIIPADGRYLFFEDISVIDGFLVKDQKFTLQKLLQDSELAKRYQNASMVIARLCPSDYHRYHFPVDCWASLTKTINGWLYSVNPIALKRNIAIFSENQRTLCQLQSSHFGTILFLEIGATCVGKIQQTYEAGLYQYKGNEKGYFAFGGSSLIMLFEPHKIQFDADLLQASAQKHEIYCQMGQSMGYTPST